MAGRSPKHRLACLGYYVAGNPLGPVLAALMTPPIKESLFQGAQEAAVERSIARALTWDRVLPSNSAHEERRTALIAAIGRPARLAISRS
jgi:hypothetical protein